MDIETIQDAYSLYRTARNAYDIYKKVNSTISPARKARMPKSRKGNNRNRLKATPSQWNVAQNSTKRKADSITPGVPIVAERSHSSGSSTLKKPAMRADVATTGLEIVERPLRLVNSKKGDTPKSVWSSLRDMVSGKKVLKNTFSFKMVSERDKRGLMALPFRHDGNMDMEDTNYWAVGSQTTNEVAATYVPGTTTGYKAYSTMLDTPAQTTYTTLPPFDTTNVLVPRLNLPTLEQTSWDLNNMKMYSGANLLHSTQDTDGGGRQSMVTPMMQLGGNAVPRASDGSSLSNMLENSYPSANSSYARLQYVRPKTGDPQKKTLYDMPRFKTQLGGGTVKMRLCNQGTNSCTVEFVVVKVANPYLGKHKPDGGAGGDFLSDSDFNANMTRCWANLYNTVGFEHAKKVQQNLSYKMGSTPGSQDELQLEVINNPYKPWLPASCFKSRFDQGGVGSTINNPVGGLVTSDDVGADEFADNFDAALPYGPVAGPNQQGAGAGQTTPYRVVSRGHCSISGAAERTVHIALPGSNYDASKIQSVAQDMKDGATQKIDGAPQCLMSDESYIVLMSVNGSLQDIIEPELDTTGASTGNVKVIGKAYTSSIIDCYCQYTENVFPSHCDYSAIGPVAYNLGTARGAQVKASNLAFPGKVLPMSRAIPVTQAGVLRTGASDRAGDNAGAT